MLQRRTAAGGAPLASLGPQAVQAAGAAAAPPMPQTAGPSAFAETPQMLAAGGVDVARSMAAMPRVAARLGEGLADAVLGEAAGSLVRKLGQLAPQRVAGDWLEEKALKPASQFYEGGEAARRDAREAPLGEKLKEPGWALRQGVRQIPQLATSLVSVGAKGASLASKLVAPFVMEAGEAARGLEEEESRSGEKIDNLRFGAAVAGKGAVNAGLELAGAEAILGRLTKYLPASVKRTLGKNVAEFLTGSAGEGLTERGQQVVGNFATMMATDPPKNFLDLAARARTSEFWQALDKGGAEAQFLGSFVGTGATALHGASRAADVRERAGRMADRRDWRAEEGPGTPPAPLPFAESGPGRGAVPQADIDGINEAVRALQNPETADEGIRQPQAPEAPVAPQPAHRPISVDQLLGAQALGDVVKETRFRDQTADARGRNVLNAVAGEERQRVANTPGAALRMILGDDPAFAPRPAAEASPQEVSEVSQGSGVSLRPRVSTPVLDWIEQRSGEVDEDRRTLTPEEWSHDESRYFALTDPGLGLPNRAAYQIAERQNPKALQGVLDVDGLKGFNDTFGHEDGDEYLGMVPLHARQAGLRLFRVGGDEFVAMYEGDESEFRKKLETARDALEASRVSGSRETGEEYPLHKGFSYGIGPDFKTADAQAYEDKRRRKAGSAAGTDREVHPQPVGVGRGDGQEAAAGPRNSARVPPPVRGPGNDDSGSSGAPPAGPASLPPPVTPAAPAAAAAPPPRTPRPLLEPTGSVTEAVTDDGEKVSARWEIVDGGDVIGSHDEKTQAPNPEFDQTLQPRDRVRNASEMWVEEKSKSIRPQELADSYLASSGAPIVSKDRQILSGNGRNQLLDRAYRLGRAEEYRRYLEENAPRWGKTAEDVRGKATPKLIRVLTEEPANRAELARKMNVSSVATMSASETAAADADRLTPEMLSRFEPGDGGNAILSVRNRGFVEKFFASVPANERGRLIDSEGQLSQDGVRRIQNALMAKAYGTSPVLERLAESTDDNIKTVSTALSNAAPGMAAVKAGIAKGDILPLDPVPGIVEAAAKLSHLRDTKTSVADFLDQGGLFGDEMSPEGREFLRAFEYFKRSGKRLSEFLTSLSEGLITEGGAKQETLFSDATAPRLEDFIRAARRAVSDRGQVPLFGGEGDLRADGPEADRPGPRPAGGPAGSVDDPRISLKQGPRSTPPTPRHVMLIERWARSMGAHWTDAPEVVVVATEADLPEEVRDRAQSFDATGGVDGVYMGAEDDRVFLVAARLNSREDVERVVLHEVMGHAGIRRLLGRDSFNSVMDQIAASLPEDIAAKAKAYGLKLEDKGQRREAADEVLAEWASRPDAPPRAITRAMVTIRGMLRQLFPNLKWTADDVRALLARARTRVAKGAGGERGEGLARFSRTQESTSAFKEWFGDSKVVDEQGRPKVVYHGTTADFSAFDVARSRDGGGAFFTDDVEWASVAAGGEHFARDGSRVISAFLSLQNPMVVDYGGGKLERTSDIADLITRAQGAGNDGMIVRNIRDTSSAPHTQYVAFRPEQIKSATGNRGTFDPEKKDIRFSRKAQEPANTLVALHNTNAEGIRAMERLGGVPIPSIAVTKPGISFDKYGSVTLIGDRSLVDPKRDSRNRVFESDIWSPRQPLPSRKFDRKAFARFGDKINELLGNPKEWVQRFDPNAMDQPQNERGFDRLIETFEQSGSNSFRVQRAYLLSRGTDVPLVMREESGRKEINYGGTREALEAAIEPHREDFRKWLIDELDPVFGPEHLAAGRKRLPYTLDNLVDVMRKMGLRGSEQSMFESLAKQKAKTSRELRSVEAMHRAEGKLTSEFDMEQAKEAMNADFYTFADGLGQNRLFSGPFARLDEASASLGDAMKRGLSPETLKRAVMERGFSEPSAETLDAGVEVARAIQQAPTQYFEAKPQRAVSLTEFRGAVIPDDSPADIRGVLERAGVEVRTYESGNADARREAVEALSEKRDIRFSRTSRTGAASSSEDRIYDAMVARARQRATASAEAARRVRAELEDPGDVMEARRDQELPEHSREVQNHIRPAGNRETVKGLLNPTEALYQQLVRRHFAVEKAGAQMGTGTGPAHRDPGIVAELAAGHSARAEQMIAGGGGFRNGANGNIEWTGNRSLEAILKDLGPGRLNELRRYLVARRAIELHHRTPPQQELGATQERTIYSGITEAAAQQEVAGAPEDIKEAAKQVTALLDDALRYWADSGGLSPAAVDVIRDMNRAYVPFYRIFEGKEPGKQGRLVLPAKRGAALQSEQAVKTIFGSQRDILDPLVAVVDHIQRMVRAADLNRVGKTLVEAAALNPEGAFGLVEEVSTGRGPAEGVTNEGKAVQDAASNFGVEVDDEAASALSFLSDKKLSYADDRIKVWQAGKLKEYRVAREIGESLRALGPEETTLFKKAVTFPATLLRGGVTKNPMFQLHNFLRDTADAGVQSRNGFIPVLDSIRGFKEAISDGSLRREWLAAGGGFATISGGGLKGAEKTIREIAPRTRTQSVLRTVIHPLEALSVFGRPFEEAARLGEFRKARLAGKNATEAAIDAARVTTNFTVHGADAAFWWLAKSSAFTNPAIQGADKAFRTILEAPRGETQSAGRIGRAAAAVAVRGLLNVSLLSAVLYAMNWGDDEVEELRKTKAGSVWWFMRVPKTKVILRFPKPFLWGQMFGTGMETILDKARGTDPDAMKRWRDEVLEMLTDNVFPIPTPAKMAHELTANKSLFFKRPIVPRGLEGAEPEMQVTPRTGETARQVGKLASGLPDVTGVGWLKSPAKFEHAVGGIGGTLAREVLKASDSVLREPGSSPPARKLSETPLAGRMFAAGGTGTYSVERFWREMDRVRTAKTTLREKMKSDRAGARAYGQKMARELRAFDSYSATAERLGDLRKSIEAIRKAPDSRYTPKEKRKRMDALEARMNELAKRTVSRGLLEETER